VAQVQSALEMAGIPCTLRNEYAGGASGELAPLETWPEIWVLRDRDHDRAMAQPRDIRFLLALRPGQVSGAIEDKKPGAGPGSLSRQWRGNLQQPRLLTAVHHEVDRRHDLLI
jgi:hypothetical protein